MARRGYRAGWREGRGGVRCAGSRPGGAVAAAGADQGPM